MCLYQVGLTVSTDQWWIFERLTWVVKDFLRGEGADALWK
jgi:hypothetical protein